MGDGALARVVSAHRGIEVPVRFNTDLAPGTVAVPHGWGDRDAGWSTADRGGRGERQ